MRIYNTMNQKKEELIPGSSGEIKIYICGPTVYNFIHIGNARPLCVFDVLRRYLEYSGEKVLFVQNFTDIDDKIINRAREEGVDYQKIAGQYIGEYWTDAKGLNVREADIHPKATENIPQMIEMIGSLIDKGFAYTAGNGDVYFRTRQFADYGKLSRQPLDDLRAGARISVGETKEDPMDFALWKESRPGEPFWESPWGRGRPGWHIECSAMVKRYLGETADIHGGGYDLIFPHHENEIAQSECGNGTVFSRYWMHNGFINVDSKKMAKSLGNFFTVREVARQYGYEPIRYFLIASHYRSPINYTAEVLDQAKASLERLYTCRDNLTFRLENAADNNAGEQDAAALQMLERRRRQFTAAMEDDLNTADALAAVFDLVRDIHSQLAGELSKDTIASLLAGFGDLTGVLGLLYERQPESQDQDTAEIEGLIAARKTARGAKNWAESDRIRDQLRGMGIILEDTPQGIKWHRER
ncbi:MAG: cysteine--tRNA ligase [Oscillospiraceae bacterium]|nr:cysteine--tRNA ligase [Oscillospiraceae bacterium]